MIIDMHAHWRPQALAEALKKRTKPPLIETNAEGKEVYRDHRRSVPAHTMFDDMDARFASMNRYGISANLMSLGGLAIAIGIMVDGSVVVVEITFAKVGERLKSGESKNRVILEAAAEVGKPVLFGVGIIILVFMPLLSLEGMEGKMFAPMAITIAIALAISLILSFTLSPVLRSYILKGGSEEDTKIVKKLRTPYDRWLSWSLSNPKLVVKRSLIALGKPEWATDPAYVFSLQFQRRLGRASIKKVPLPHIGSNKV